MIKGGDHIPINIDIVKEVSKTLLDMPTTDRDDVDELKKNRTMSPRQSADAAMGRPSLWKQPNSVEYVKKCVLANRHNQATALYYLTLSVRHRAN